MGTSGLLGTLKKYPATFWVANTMEIFERMAWYGFFAVSSLYITGRVEDGALGFSSEQRGLLQGVVTFFLYLFPVVTGALGDRFGYKKMFLLAYTVLTPAYFLLGQFHTFGGFFAAFMLVAVGAAMFKPVVVGTVARVTNASTAGLGFGIFYMMVNIGGFIGPAIAGVVRTSHGWSWVFSASAIWISINFLWVLLLYKEPTTESASANRRSLRQVVNNIVEVLGNGRFFLAVMVVLVLLVLGSKWLPGMVIVYACLGWVAANVLYDVLLRGSKVSGASWLTRPMKLGDWRFGLFLLLLSGFWTIFNQIFMTMPEYLRDFTDTRPILAWLQTVFSTVGMTGSAEHMGQLVKEGYQINPEYLINLDAGAIVVFQILVSWGLARLPAFTTMIVGLLVTSAGIGFAALGGAGVGVTAWIAVVSILVFAFGEMATSPKSQEYIGRIAPPDRVALYMGYYFVSIALGNLFGGLLSGNLYAKLARDMHRPDLMWLVFAGLGLITAAALFAYNKIALPRREEAGDRPAANSA